MIALALALTVAAAVPSSDDLANLLGSWGPCVGCAADLNSDGVVDAADLAMLLGGYAPGQKPAPAHVPGVAIRYDANWIGFNTIAMEPVVVRVEDIRQVWSQPGDTCRVVLAHGTDGSDVSIVFADCSISEMMRAVR